MLLRCCLVHHEAEHDLNDFHAGACGGHLSGLATAQKFLCTDYFWPSIFKDCVEVVKRCHPCQIFTRKIHTPPAPLFPVLTVSPFAKWGIDFMTCKPTSTIGHHYIIVAVDYFTKWEEAMPTRLNNGETTTLFIFNHIIATFGVPKELVSDHGSHFQNRMVDELEAMLGFCHEYASSYYPRANGQVEEINKVLKTML